MKSVSTIALGAALALGGSLAFADAAEAQRAPRGNQQQARPAQPTFQVQGRTLNLSREERTALVALETAARGTDRAAQDAALAAAQNVMRGNDARYAFGRYQLAIGDQRQDNRLVMQGLDTVIGTGVAAPDEMVVFLGLQARLASEARDFRTAERALARLVEMRPNDVSTMASLAQLRVQQGNPTEGLQMLQRAIAAQQAAGQPAPESWHRFALRAAYDSQDQRLRGQSVGLARALVAAYPTAVNWRDALLIYREVGGLDVQTQIDAWRLMRAAGALSGERDYSDFATALNQGGYPAEAKAVLDEGVSRRMIDPSRSPFRELLQIASRRIPADRNDLPAAQRSAFAAATGTPALRTGDAMLGYGRYADAVALYRAALQKGGVDANLVNTRIGIALALAGQRAEAEAALRSVTGPRAELAQFWLLWLQQRAG